MTSQRSTVRKASNKLNKDKDADHGITSLQA